MFFFLSKLLPLFIYPLGLTCLLLVVALFTLRKRPKIATTAIALALTVLLLSSHSWVATYLIRSLEWQYLPQANYPKVDAIVVLGGGTKPQIAPRPGVDVAEGGDRVLYGAELYRQGKAPWLILSGGRVDWRGGSGSSESQDMAAIAKTLGVPESAILQDRTSLNTYQNAVNVKQILTKRGLRRVLLVTSAMHMPRSILIFQRQGIDTIAAPTDFLVTEADRIEEHLGPKSLIFGFLPDVEKMVGSTRVIKEYIGLLVYRLRGWA